MNGAILTHLKTCTYDTYEKANPIENPYQHVMNAKDRQVYNPNTWGNIRRLLPGLLELLLVILLPYILVVSVLLVLVFVAFQVHMIFIMSLLTLFVILYSKWLYYQDPKINKVYSKSLKPGVYYRDEGYMKTLMNNFQLLKHFSKEVTQGKIPIKRIGNSHPDSVSFLPATPWILCGHLRTLFPFLFFRIPQFAYQRRWVRVPADDRRPSRQHLTSPEHFEAVALDYYPSKMSESTEKDECKHPSQPPKALLILAGLTGGSEEGYIRDLVAYASRHGWHSFVMVGRGMAQTPLYSQVFFHGARTSDLVTCAEIVRQTIGTSGYLLAIGVSMGGIIMSNAVVKSSLTKYVDGMITIAGSQNIRDNQTYLTSRRLWQPLLIQGLREALFVPAHFWYLFQEIALKQASQEYATQIIDSIQDLYDWDYIIAPTIAEFPSGEAYQTAMCATRKDMLSSKHPGIQHVTQLLNQNTSKTVQEDEEKDKEEQETEQEVVFSLKKNTVRAQRILGESSAGSNLSLQKPFMVIHAADDPIIHIDSSVPHANVTIAPGKPLILHNHLVVVTETGGHVGWPVGWTPWKYGFHFMNTLVIDFGEAIVSTGKQEE